MRLKNLDLILVLILVLANVGWMFLPVHPPVIGVILPLPLIFVLPGYVLTEALFRRRALEGLQRLVFSLILSLALAVFCGFILNFLPGGLNTLSWLATLSGLTAFFTLLAYLRRRGFREEKGTGKFQVKFLNVLLFGLALALMVFSVVYSVIGAQQQRLPGFTQLWIVPPSHSSGAGSCAVSVGIHSFESTTQTYHLIVTNNNVQINVIPPLSLLSQQQWEQVISIVPKKGNNLIEVRLYRDNQPTVIYRNVHLTLHSSATGISSSCTY